MMRNLSDSARANWSMLLAVVLAAVVLSPRLLEVLRGDLSRDERSQITVLLLLVAWPIFVVSYLAWTYFTFSKRAPQPSNRKLGFWARLLKGDGTSDWPLFAAVIAIVMTMTIAQDAEYRSDPFYISLGMLAVVCSWALMVTSFALNYYRLNADPAAQSKPHVTFAFDEQASLSDYLTLAVLLSTMAAAVSARINSRDAWRLVRANVLFAFTFNTVIVAMVVALLFGGLTS